MKKVRLIRDKIINIMMTPAVNMGWNYVINNPRDVAFMSLDYLKDYAKSIIIPKLVCLKGYAKSIIISTSDLVTVNLNYFLLGSAICTTILGAGLSYHKHIIILHLALGGITSGPMAAFFLEKLVFTENNPGFIHAGLATGSFMGLIMGYTAYALLPQSNSCLASETNCENDPYTNEINAIGDQQEYTNEFFNLS